MLVMLWNKETNKFEWLHKVERINFLTNDFIVTYKCTPKGTVQRRVTYSTQTYNMEAITD